ncbi:MAG: hypothetical protein Q8876_08805 [Bacillota bacterium]|nr:hypothetical protein [Bacillota bacterium]
MKKRQKIIITVLVVTMIISAAGLFTYLYKPIYYRVYPFDRIKGTISVSVNGKATAVDSSSLKCISGNNGHQRVSVSVIKDNLLKFSTNAGVYDSYYFEFSLNDKSLPKEILEQKPSFKYLNTCWYRVSTLNFKINYVKINSKWIAKTRVDYSYLDTQNYKMISASDSQEIDLTKKPENDYWICFGM